MQEKKLQIKWEKLNKTRKILKKEKNVGKMCIERVANIEF